MENRDTVDGIVNLSFLTFIKRYEPPSKDNRSYFDPCYVPAMWLRVARRVPPDHLFMYSTCKARHDTMLEKLIECRVNLDKRILHEGNEELALWADKRPGYSLSMTCSLQLRNRPCWHAVVRDWLAGLSIGSGVPMRRLFLVYSSGILLSHFSQDKGGWRRHLENEVRGWCKWLGEEIGEMESRLA